VSIPTFDLNRANQLLDEAGLMWGDDGFRVDLYGQAFYLNIGMTYASFNEIIFEMHRENLAYIGLDLRRYPGTTAGEGAWMEPNDIWEYASSNGRNSPMHMYMLSYTLWPLPDPARHWGHIGPNFNVGGFYHEDLPAILYDIASVNALDDAFLLDAYRRFESLFGAQLPAIPQHWMHRIVVVNQRVANWTLERGQYHDNAFSWHTVGLTADAPYVHR